MPKPLYQARYRGQPEWDWEYSTRGYTVTDLEKAKKPTYKWLEEAKKRNKPLQVQVVIVDPEKRWGEVVWEDFYKKEEFYRNAEAERCQIVRDITKDLLEEECQAEDDKCRIAKEITEDIVERECNPEGEKMVHRIREYSTMAEFMQAVRRAFKNVFGHDDYLTLIDNGETKEVGERIRLGESVSYSEGSKEFGYKLGWDIEFPDRIYIYYTPVWKDGEIV